MAATPHNHAPSFGRRFADCPRCAELDQGAAPVAWRRSRRADDARLCAEIAAHRCGPSCGAVCTFGEW